MKIKWLDNFLGLFFPSLCLSCGGNRPSVEGIICVTCHRKLPYTNLHLLVENQFTDRFVGRVKIERGAALYNFKKESGVQLLIHHLKYYNKPRIGVKLGELYGRKLLKANTFSNVDVIVPVPIHFRRKTVRGYNQSDQFAIGLSNTLNITWISNALKRKTHTASQTKKTKIERFENVLSAIEVKRPDVLKDKHILLVDDVLTTGATLEACAMKILEIPNTKISMATIAMAGLD